MTWRVGPLDGDWFPVRHPQYPWEELKADPAALLAVPAYTAAEARRATNVVHVATPHVLASVDALVGPTPASTTRRPSQAPEVWIETNKAWVAASGDATPGRALLDLTLPLDWETIGNSPLVSLDSGRHLIVYATDHQTWSRPTRVLALRTVPRPHIAGPPSATERIFQLAWATLGWTSDDHDDEDAPASVLWSPEPATINQLLNQQDLHYHGL